MMLRFACRSLAMSPVKTVVLASGFGLGVAIMAILLGIGEVILEQAHSPALQGGGDVTVAGAFGSVDSARFVLSSVLGAGEMRPRVAAASPSKRSTLYLIAPDKVWAISARGGVPSRDTIREHISGNYCRCTGYQAIVDAIESVAQARQEGKTP